MYGAPSFGASSLNRGGGVGGGGLPAPLQQDRDSRRACRCLEPTKDGRLHLSFECASTLSRSKVAFSALLLVCSLWFFLGPSIGLGVSSSELALRQRIRNLEATLAKRVSWLTQHSSHLGSHLSRRGAAWAPSVHADGRKHLLSDPDGVSRLSEYLAPNTQLAPEVSDHYLCGENAEVTESEVVRKKLAIVVVTWRAPLSLRHSLESWRDNGLLDLVDEKMIFINSPQQVDYDLAKEFDFDIYTTEERDGNIMAGPALTYLVGNTTADYVLFMEKDFDLNSAKAVTARELYLGMQMMARGVDVYRLRGANDYPAEGMPDCCTPATPPTCPFHSNWRSGGYFGDHMNWLLLFCQKDPVASANGRLVQCTSEPSAPTSYCFGSGDTNWSNNPLIMGKEWYLSRLKDVAMNGEKAWTQNNMFEFNVMMEWLAWRPVAKVCVSYQGIFSEWLEGTEAVFKAALRARTPLLTSALAHAQLAPRTPLTLAPHSLTQNLYLNATAHHEVDQ